MKKRIFTQALLGVSVILLAGCQTARNQQVVVENQEYVLKHFTHVTEEVFPLTISMDIPVKGPQCVLDSITVFLNETLYKFYDDGMDRHIPYDRVYSEDTGRLLSHYRDSYTSYFLNDSTYMHEFGSDCLEVKLAAQTDTYVTYEIDWIFFGEGVEIMTDWATFFLSDGHRLKEIISPADLLRFYQEHPEYRSDIVWENVCYESQETDGDGMCGINGTVGLLKDSLAHQYAYFAGVFEDLKYPLDAIAPYLSEEAQALAKAR